MMINRTVADDVAAYRAGATIEDLARLRGVSYGTLRRRLLDAGVQLRPPGRRPVGRLRSRPMAGATEAAR